MKPLVKIAPLLLVLTACFLPLFCFGQERYEEMPYDTLWKIYEKKRSNDYYYYYENNRALIVRNAIAKKAYQEQNAYHYFKASAIGYRLKHTWDEKYHLFFASEWGDPDSNLYNALNFYVMAQDFNSERSYLLRQCFDLMPQNVPLNDGEWDFFTNFENLQSHPFTTLNDLLTAEGLPLVVGDTVMVNYLIDKAISAHQDPADRQKVIEFEILRLQQFISDITYPVDSSEYWKALNRLEATYGSDVALDLARGLALALFNQTTNGAHDYGTMALEYYDKILNSPVTGYYREEAHRCRAELLARHMESASMNCVLPPAHKLRLPVTCTNVDTLYVSVFPAKYRGLIHRPYRLNTSHADYCQPKEEYLSTLLFTQRFVVDCHEPGRPITTELWLDSLPLGEYELYFHTQPELNTAGALMESELRVSHLFVSSWEAPVKRCVAINDRLTGKPIVSGYGTYPFALTLPNRFGEMTYSTRWHYYNNNEFILHERGVRTPSSYQIINHYKGTYRHSMRGRRYYSFVHYYGMLIPDRTLYRPGQTVYFKLYVMNRRGKLLKNKKLDISLYGSWDEEDLLEVTTSEFGSATGSFRLPEGKVGHFKFDAETREGKEIYLFPYQTFTVADYKRPTFKVEWLFDTLQPAPGDSLVIRGKAITLNGQPVRDASVELEVSDNWGKENLKTYQLFTQYDGTFSQPVFIPYAMTSQHLCIQATVTDLNGETREANTSFTVDPERLRIQVSGRENYDLATDSAAAWKIRPENVLSIKQQMPFQVTVVRLQPPAEYKEPVLEDVPAYWRPQHSVDEYSRLYPALTFNFQHNDPDTWPAADTLYHAVHHSATDSLLSFDLAHWPAGNYRITVSGNDVKGKEISNVQHFFINDSRTEKFVPYQPVHTSFTAFPQKAGDKVTVTVGSCLHNAIVISDVYQGKRRLKTVRTDLDGTQRSFTVKTRKHGKSNLSVVSRIVQNEHLYYCTLDSIVPYSEKVVKRAMKRYEKYALDMELTHNHDIAEPGSEEEWEIQIKNSKDKPVHQAELLAWMTDCSLYELGMKVPEIMQDYSYSVKPRPISVASYSSLHQYKFTSQKGLSHLFLWKLAKGKTVTVLDADFEIAYCAPQFDAVHTYTSAVRGNRSDGTKTVIDGVVVRGTEGVESVDGELQEVRGEPSDDESVVPEKEESPQLPPIRFRNNFTETAFFYPQLHTDESGRIRFSFTLPDQFTRWQFFAYAHTNGRRVRSQKFTTYVQSRLSLMLQSNAPRFFREGDTMTLRVKINSLCDTVLRGTATAAFYDPETGAPLSLLTEPADSVQPFQCEANGTATAAWRIAIPEGITAVKYRLSARAGHCSDGEENILPVLPNRTLVIETMNFIVPVHTDTTLVFDSYRDFTKKLLTRSSRSLPIPIAYTAEFTTNPTWLALYALPDLISYPYECNEQVFSKLFATSTVLHALDQVDGLDSLLQSWRDDTLTAISPLLTNGNLKEMLLEETPWLRNAQNESSQRKDIAEIFQEENLQRILQKNLNKLSANQLSGGGWGWYGSYSYSGYITAHITAGLFKLSRIGVDNDKMESMAWKAIRRMDREHEEAYQQFLKDKEKDSLLTFPFCEEDVHYLYARSFANADSTWYSQPYVQNLIAFATKDILHANYMRQAEVALFLHRLGRTEEAMKIVTSLRRDAVHDAKTGIYWRDEYSGCHYFPWYHAPVERQAVLLEAFAEISPREEELTAMKQWLLQNKKNNSWYSTKATTEAVYALLLHAPAEMLAPATTTIAVGGELLLGEGTGSATGATGYVKQTWQPETMTPALADIAIRTDSVHPLFGACYWQYTEQADKVGAFGEGLTVRRTIYHREPDEMGRRVPVTAESPARLGEKLTVRIELTSDRDLMYVHVKDPRAAAFEPVNFRERWNSYQETGWVESPRDAATHFFFNRLPEGKVVMEYEVFATQTGDFTCGGTTVECMYAPEHRAQSKGERIGVR